LQFCVSISIPAITQIIIAMYKQLLPAIGLLLLIRTGLPAQPAKNTGLYFGIKSIQLPTGVRLQYAEQGMTTGIPVILLHGFTDSWHSWELVLPYLPEGIHAFALSQRGYGDSGRPPEGYDPQDFATDVAAFMEAMHIEKAIVVGHSVGAVIAQKFAIDYPSKTMGIVLTGSLFQSEYIKALAEYLKPALVIWGDKDVLAPRKDQEILAGAMKRSQLIVYTGAGHDLHWEEPVKFAEDLVVFVRQLTFLR
jgi:pimeloyl-ACP methyl ester carboxylesterase